MAHVEEITDEEIEQTSDFEEKMLKLGNRDFAHAIDFMDPIRRDWLNRWNLYHRGQAYEELRKQEQYPTDFYADQVDTFVSSMMQPLWDKDQPCKLIPGPKADSKAIEAKQKLHEFQNREDDLETTHEQLIQSVALNGIAIAKTDYLEKTERIWGTEQAPTFQTMQEIDLATQQVVDTFEEPVIDPETGEQATHAVSVPIDFPIYKGPHTEWIDPQDFFFSVDKRRQDDGPVMIRSYVSKEFFEGKKFFKNIEKLKQPGEYDRPHDDDKDYARQKRRILKLRRDDKPSKNNHLYVEWQGLVDKGELFAYLGPKLEKDPVTGEMVDKHSKELVAKGEKMLCVLGIADAEVVVRLEARPLLMDHSNIVVGIMQPIDNEMVGNSVGQKLKPAGLMLDKLAGVMFKGLRLAVNRGHVINVNAVEGGSSAVPDVNQDGWVLHALTGVSDVHTVLEQPSVADDVYRGIGLVTEWGRNRGSQEVASGKSDPNAETLGENVLVAQSTSTRSSNPLKQIEGTLIIPITRMRDEINQQFLSDPDDEYLVEVIGKDNARNWEQITPEQIRTHTRFVCESSGREHSKAVLTQQLLQANQVAPNALAAGQPVRLDRLLYQLQTMGFGFSEEEAGWWLPAVKQELEDGSGEQMDQLMAQTQQMTEQNKFLAQQVQAMQLQIQMMFPLGLPMEGGENGQGGGGSTTSPGQELPQSTSEQGVTESANQRNLTSVG